MSTCMRARFSPFQRRSVARRSVVETSGIEMSACVVAVVSQVAVLVDVEAVLGCYAAVEALQTHLHRYVSALQSCIRTRVSDERLTNK